MKPSEGIAAIDAAVERGKGAILAAADRYHGTVPPPPWPSPELYAAIDDANDAKERLESLQRLLGDRDYDPAQPKVKAIVEQIRTRVARVDAEAGKLSKRSNEALTLPDVVQKGRALARFSVSPPLLLLGVLFLLERSGRD